MNPTVERREAKLRDGRTACSKTWLPHHFEGDTPTNARSFEIYRPLGHVFRRRHEARGKSMIP
jgi:hypothetical protein